MNAYLPTLRRFPPHVAAWLALVATALAQSSTSSAAELARYDVNRNGRLEPDELAARDAAANTAPIVISPFEVRSEGRGYYASNTMSGTRLNSKVEDLASSLTVVTKEQMNDFAMLNINDVFLYESGTEGTGTFTDFSFDRNGLPGDNTQLDPNNANRIRGVGPANMSFGNFEASGRVPVDPINIDGVEISRGPNSTVFGLGSAAGTVNLQPATANLQRDRSQLVGRLDSYGGSRASADLNRVLKRGVLALRGSAVYQHDAFDRKPSGTDTVRLNGMLKYQPFKYTTITASHSYYRIQGNRPNTTMPRDAITGWRMAGSPTWDPVTATGTLNGARLGPFTSATVPTYFVHRATPIETNATLYIDGDGRVGYWGPNRTTSDLANPNNANQNVFLVQTVPEPIRNGQPLFSSVPSVSSREIYDWTSVNLAAVNFIRDTTRTSYAEVEQIFFNTPRHMLAATAGFFREDSLRYERNIMGGSNSFGWSGFLRLDVNERLVDGRPNPYFLRPFVGLAQPYSFDSPQRRQTYRAQVAYKLDLRKEKGALRWLGLQQLSGYGEYKDLVTRRISYRDVILSPHAWLPPGTSRANQGAGAGLPSAPNISRGYFQYYVGDAVGYNVDYAPRDFHPGYNDYTWGNGVTGQFRTEQALLGRAMSGDGSGAGSNTRNILKTEGVVLQSHLFRDRLVTTFGLRRDRSYNTRGAPPRFLADGITLDPDSLNRWLDADWAYRSGQTKTAGAVLKVRPWLSLHGNVSDSFQPAPYAVNLVGSKNSCGLSVIEFQEATEALAGLNPTG